MIEPRDPLEDVSSSDEMLASVARITAGNATQSDWDRYAHWAAVGEQEANLHSPRGAAVITDTVPPTLALYDNNSYPGHPTRRDEELAELRDRLVEVGIVTLAMGRYPPSTPSDVIPGDTVSMIVAAKADELPQVVEVWREILRQSARAYERRS